MKLLILAALVAIAFAQDDCTDTTVTTYNCGGSGNANIFQFCVPVNNVSGLDYSNSVCFSSGTVQDYHCAVADVNYTQAAIQALIDGTTQAAADAFATSQESAETACNDNPDTTANCGCADFCSTETCFCENAALGVPPACTAGDTIDDTDTTVATGTLCYECCLECNNEAYCTANSGTGQSFAAEGDTACCEDACTAGGDSASAISAFWL